MLTIFAFYIMLFRFKTLVTSMPSISSFVFGGYYVRPKQASAFALFPSSMPQLYTSSALWDPFSQTRQLVTEELFGFSQLPCENFISQKTKLFERRKRLRAKSSLQEIQRLTHLWTNTNTNLVILKKCHICYLHVSNGTRRQMPQNYILSNSS